LKSKRKTEPIIENNKSKSNSSGGVGKKRKVFKREQLNPNFDPTDKPANSSNLTNGSGYSSLKSGRLSDKTKGDLGLYLTTKRKSQ